MELGIPINHSRFSQFFKLTKSPGLFSEKPILNSDDQIRMFVAMEGSFKHPQELVAIVVRGLKLVTIRHMIGSNKKPTYEEELDIKHVHGLVSSPHTPCSRVRMCEVLKELIHDTNPIEIVYWDDRLTNFLPSS